MRLSNQTPEVSPSHLQAESQRYYSQAVGACLARLQRSVELLGQPLLSDGQSASLLCDIDTQTERLNTLVRHVLAAGGLSALTAFDSPEPVALLGLLTTLVDEYQAASPEAPFTLQFLAQPTTPGFAVPCVLLALQLLLDNALRCSPPAQPIAVVCEDEPVAGGWQFHVQDRGAGIAPESLDCLFDHPNQAAPAPIYGLGLTLARFVVEALGGHMWVASQLGEGATFSFSLPRHVLPRRWTVSRPKVMVIEANTDLSATLKAGYEEAGFEVEIAPTAEAGLARVSDFAPNLVLLELSPSSRAGQACLATLRQCSEAAVIFLVAPDERASVADALWQGASDCLVKPFHIRELLARTRAILRRRQSGAASASRSAARPRPHWLQGPKINPLLQ